MIDITKTDVLAIAPELATGTRPVLDPAWTDILLYVNQFVMTSTDTDQDRRMARIFLAAHMGKMDQLARNAAAGPLTSESVGGIRRSYGQLAAWGGISSLSSTRYGQLYLEVIGMSDCAGPMVV